MAIIDLVKWDGSPDVIAWKFPSEELSTWTQLIVNETQEAFLVSGGVYEGPFGAGRHVLKTENLPVLRSLMGLPFGGQSPFSAEVWFINRAINLDIRWGTPDPIQVKDPAYQIMVPVRAFGQYGIRINDPKKFLLKLVGTLPRFDAKLLSEYFRGTFLSTIKVEIANAIVRGGTSVLEISADLTRISKSIQESLSPAVDDYGLDLVQFNVISINVPEEDPAVSKLKAALAKKAEMGILGFNYQQERSFDVLQTAAGNEGTAAGLMGAGIGLGMGGAIGVGVGQAMNDLSGNLNSGVANSKTNHDSSTSTGEKSIPAHSITPAERISLLKELAELKNQGILTESEFQAEKTRILGGQA